VEEEAAELRASNERSAAAAEAEAEALRQVCVYVTTSKGQGAFT